MRARRIVTVAALGTLTILPVSLAGAAGAATPTTATQPVLRLLPLGPAGQRQSVQTRQLAPGVTFTTVRAGVASPRNFWTVTVGFFTGRAAAASLAAQLRAAGFPPRVERVQGRAMDDPATGPLGYVVRTGHSEHQGAMDALAVRLTAAGFTPSVTNTAFNGQPSTGPWVVRILDIDPSRYRGQVRSHLATGVVPGTQTVSSLTARLHATAGTNGGYFVVDPADGTVGDLAGISMRAGRLVSEAVNGRAALILRAAGTRPAVRRLTTRITVTAGGASRLVNGRNRAPGLIRSCGEPGDQPTARPKHDFTCTNPDELIQFDRDFGRTADSGRGVQAVLDGDGRVLRLMSSRGGPIPAGGSLIEGIGAGARWLTGHARPGAVLRIRVMTQDVAGHRVDATPGTDIVNGGPVLVRGGRPYVDANAEGFVQPDIPAFYYGFGVQRNPRTMAGVTAAGHLLLVTVDGRQPAYSIGLSFPEEAAVMTALGSKDALNLDGGGSTTMAIRGHLLGRPSDSTGERPVGDAIVLLPR